MKGCEISESNALGNTDAVITDKALSHGVELYEIIGFHLVILERNCREHF